MIKVYVPDHSLQGSEIPIYILWDPSEQIDTIKIEYPIYVNIQEIYNVSREDDYYLKDNILFIKNVDVKGYLGVKFKSSLVDPRSKGYFRVSIYKDGNLIHSYEKNVILFRPDIILLESPDHIDVTLDDNKIKISNKIKIVNNGMGTAILRIKSSEASDLDIFDPMGVDEFRKGFWNDAEKRLSKLKEKYPQYEHLIIGFINFGKNPPIFDEINLKKLKDLFEGLVVAFEENEDFLKDFANAILVSYLKNISIVTELESFMMYLKTVYENKVIFIDGISAIKVFTTPKKLFATLYITDLAYNKYKPIELTIIITSNKETIIPLYLLFDFVSIKKEGD